MKWQLVKKYNLDEDKANLKHRILLKMFGARLHNKPELNAFEYRLAEFRILKIPGPMTIREYIKIPIPFLKWDITFSWNEV